MMKNSNLMTRAAMTLLVMMLTAATAWAWEGSGTATAPYQINNYDDWRTFQSSTDTYSGKFFILNADVSINAYYRNTTFKGTFDGNGHTITIRLSEYKGNCGLFKIVEGGTIKNLTVSGLITFNDRITDESGHGGIVGYLDKGGTVTNCTSKVEIHDGYLNSGSSWSNYEVKHIGGVVGSMYAASKVTNCSFEGYIECRQSCDAIGGIVGYGSDNGNNEISNCLSTGSIRISPFQGDREPWNEYQGAILGYTKNTTFAAKCVNNYYKENMLEVNRTVVNRISGRVTVGGSSKTDAELKSGKVSRLLNGGNGTTETASGSWGNTVGSNYPSIGGAKVYSVSFNGNGNTGGSMSTAYCNASPLPDNKFTKTYYTFLGWSTSATGSTISSVNSDCTLYAKWTVNQYTVTFNGNGSTGGSMSNQGFTYGVAQNLTANAFTRTGYTFAGWNTKADGTGTNYNDKQSVSNLTTAANGTVTLYAKWTAHQYSVTFNGNGSTGGSMSNQTFTYDKAQNLSANTFTRTGKLFDGWNTAANGSGTSYSDGQSVKNLTATNGATVTLYAQWKADPVYPTGSGTATAPYVINSTDQWNTFANANNYATFYGSDKHIKLGADITVTRMAGGEGHEFCGTFDGDGHTLTVSFNNSEGNAAPFREIRGATIKNLIVCGTIIGKKHSSGLVGYARGEDASVENTIENCLVNTDVSIANSETTGYLGGIVGHGLKSKLTIRGCAFTGSLTSPSNYTGGLQGWSDGNTLILKDDFFAPTSVRAANVGFHPVAIHGYGLTTVATVSNVCYTIAPTCTSEGRIAAQGTQARSIVARENVTINRIEPTGTATNYTTSGITAYSGGGIKYDGKFYYGKDDVVSLTLSHEDQEGYALTGYEAKDSHQNTVPLAQDGDNYSLTMPDDNVTVTANVVIGYYSLTLPNRMEVVSADQAAIGGKYPVGTIIQFKLESEDYVLEGDVKNGDEVLEAEADGSYTVTVRNADITITATVKKAVEPNVTLSDDDYTAKDGDVLTGSTDGTVTIENGASITLSDVEINGGIICEGTATITLVGENNVKGFNGNAGIQVGGSETTLTIKGNGSLTANGGWFGAGIGTGFVYDGTVTFGDIIIEGGSITANGGVGSAGIGTGAVDGGTAELGNIIIEGGNITANGGDYSAGIGTGAVDGGSVTLGDITIEGGSITANGGEWGAGIGTGIVGLGSVTLSTLTIYDDINLVDAITLVPIGCNIVYMHGETNVTGSESDYFIINSFSLEDYELEVVIKIKARKYAITLVNEEQHGTVTVAESAKCDESVTISVTPDSGYQLDTIEVKAANGNEVPLSDMSFTMPKSNVTITVTWKLAGLKGDVNGDGNVDISDVVALVNIILNSSSDYQAEADLNNDGSIDISDVVALVNIILGQ